MTLLDPVSHSVQTPAPEQVGCACRCQELQADNAMLKQALSASEVHVKQSRPHTATTSRTAVKLSRSTFALVPSTLVTPGPNPPCFLSAMLSCHAHHAHHQQCRLSSKSRDVHVDLHMLCSASRLDVQSTCSFLTVLSSKHAFARFLPT